MSEIFAHEPTIIIRDEYDYSNQNLRGCLTIRERNNWIRLQIELVSLQLKENFTVFRIQPPDRVEFKIISSSEGVTILEVVFYPETLEKIMRRQLQNVGIDVKCL